MSSDTPHRDQVSISFGTGDASYNQKKRLSSILDVASLCRTFIELAQTDDQIRGGAFLKLAPNPFQGNPWGPSLQSAQTWRPKPSLGSPKAGQDRSRLSRPDAIAVAIALPLLPSLEEKKNMF